MNKYYIANDFNRKYHAVGRLWTLGAIILFIMIPVAIGIHYGVTPDWRVFGTSAVIIPFIINFLSGIVEPILYAPMLGTNGEYLAFVTGNLSNLKIPCVVKAHEIYPTETGSEEHEVISTVAVATSTLVTVVIIAVLVLCLAFSNLQKVVEQNTWIMPAFSCVVYALFGSLGGKYATKNPKLSLIPAGVVVVLSVVLGVTGVGKSVGSAYLFVGIAVCLLFAILQIARDKRKQKMKEEEERLAGIADTHELENQDVATSLKDGNQAQTAEEEPEQKADEQQVEDELQSQSDEVDKDLEQVEDEQQSQPNEIRGDDTQSQSDEVREDEQQSQSDEVREVREVASDVTDNDGIGQVETEVCNCEGQSDGDEVANDLQEQSENE